MIGAFTTLLLTATAVEAATVHKAIVVCAMQMGHTMVNVFSFYKTHEKKLIKFTMQ